MRLKKSNLVLDNVYIRTKHFCNAENLTIISNGGKGADGQDGGNGRNGENGVDGVGLSEAQFSKEFPFLSYFWDYKTHKSKCKIMERITDAKTEKNTRKKRSYGHE